MKLSLAVNKPPNGHTFQATESVQGRVQLQLDEGLDVPEIRVILQGNAKVTLKPGVDATAQLGDTHRRQNRKLFSISHVVKATRQTVEDHDNHDTEDDGNCSGKARGHPKQTVSGAFSLAFPASNQCCKNSQNAQLADKLALCRLPPSTTFSTQGLKVTVSYTVTAVCRRPSTGALYRLLHHKNVAACQIIQYAPPVVDQLQYGQHLTQPEPIQGQELLDPSLPNVRLIRRTAWLPATKLGIDVGSEKTAHNREYPDTLPHGCLPPYSPAMTLEVVMRNPPVITPGQPVALGLFLRTPRALLDAVDGPESKAAGLHLCSLSVRLKRQTQGRIGEAVRIDDRAWPMWSVHGNVPIQQEKVDISWADGAPPATTGGRMQLTVPTAVQSQPGFSACFASRVYSIEVTMGVKVTDGRKKRSTSKVHYTKTAMRVILSEPPPDYEAQPAE